MEGFHGTTIVGVYKDGRGAIAGDGQVTLGEGTIFKRSARKVRRLRNGQVVAGFAGSAADGLTLFERFEEKLETFQGRLARAAVELAKEWRTDRMLRRLEAFLVVLDTTGLLVVSGTGDVIEPDDGVVAVGSGGAYALAAGRALLRHTDLPVESVAREALLIASEICVYTNDHVVVETVG